jgi:hypothetical protein
VRIPRNVCLSRKKVIHSFFFSIILFIVLLLIFRSIIHSAALKYSILHHLLFAVLRPVALAPDSYTYPRPLFHVAPMTTTAPPKETKISSISSPGAGIANDGNRRNSGAFASVNPSGTGTKRNSLRTQSTRFLGMVRGLLGGGGSGNNSGSNSVNKDNKDDKSAGEKERPQSADMNRTIGSFSNYYHFLSPPVGNNDGGSNNPEYIRQQQLLSLEELASLNPSELKRIETRKKLLDCAFLLTNRLDEICPYFPIAIKKIILTIRDLIIITNHDANFHAGGSNNLSGSSGGGRDGFSNRQLPPLPPNISQNHMHSQATTNASTGIGTGDYVNEQDKINETIEEENKAELYKNRRRFEYGTFFTSCSALLFLRLICRAIISPDDYGVMTNNPTLTLNTMNYTSNMDDASETSSVSLGGFSGKGEKEEDDSENAKNDHNQKDSKKAGNSSGDYPYRGLPAMYLIAATLAQFEKARAGIAATSASPVPPPVDTSKKDPFPFSSSSSPSFASEIFQFARTVSSEIEYKDVSFHSLCVFQANCCFWYISGNQTIRILSSQEIYSDNPRKCSH